MRRPRLRADRGRARRPASHPRRLAVEPRPGRALQVAPAPPHTDRLLLSEQSPEVLRDAVFEATPGNPHAARPSGREREIPFTVVFERAAGSVGAPAVELDYQLAIAPDGI